MVPGIGAPGIGGAVGAPIALGSPAAGIVPGPVAGIGGAVGAPIAVGSPAAGMVPGPVAGMVPGIGAAAPGVGAGPVSGAGLAGVLAMRIPCCMLQLYSLIFVA